MKIPIREHRNLFFKFEQGKKKKKLFVREKIKYLK